MPPITSLAPSRSLATPKTGKSGSRPATRSHAARTNCDSNWFDLLIDALVLD